MSINGEHLLVSDTMYNRESTSLKESTKKSQWPWLIWLVLKFIGLYDQPRAVTKRRLCAHCRLVDIERRCVARGEGVPEYLYPGGTGEFEKDDEDEQEAPIQSGDIEGRRVEAVTGNATSHLDNNCVVCQSEWWDVDGRYSLYTDADIGVKSWNHHGSATLSVIWQILLIILNLADYLFYFVKYWGRLDKEVDLVIYTGFILFVISVPAVCLAANIINMVPCCKNSDRSSWSNALSVRYIIKRLQHLGLGERGLPYKAFLLVCVVWPLANNIWRVVIFTFLFYRPSNFWKTVISLATCTVSTAMWGLFCYLMVLMRLSFQRQFQMELEFLRRNCNVLDRCRRRLTVCMQEFGSFGGLAATWIMFTVAVSTWGLSTIIYYDYTYDGYNGTNHQANNFSTKKPLDKLIWSENIMFLILPLVAVGGIDMNMLWMQFRRSISRLRLGGESFDKFYDEILAYCTEHPPVKNVKTKTLLVSALGLCLAVEFRQKDELDIF